MIHSHEINDAFKDVQLDSFSIEDDTSGLSILLNSYRGGPTSGAPRDYFIGIWETDASSPDLIREMVGTALSMHRDLAGQVGFPGSRLLFDLCWFDGREKATKVDQDLESVTANLPQPLIGQNRFVRLDGQFFGLVIDGITDRGMPSSSRRESPPFVSVISMFNIVELLISLHRVSISLLQESRQGRFLDYTRLSQDITSILSRFPHWTAITELGGQLDLHP